MKERMLIVNTEDADYFIDQLKYLFQKDYDITIYEIRSIKDTIKYLIKKCFDGHLDVILVTSSSGTHRILPFLIMTGVSNRIYFPYDIVNFYSPYKKGFIWNIKFKLDKFMERLVFLFTAKILHKGSENELEQLSFYKSIKNKPHFYFQQFVKEKNIFPGYGNEKLSHRNNEIHMVYVGGIYDHNDTFVESVWATIYNITNQGIHYHIYSRVDEDFAERLYKEQRRNPFFHYEGFVDHDTLLQQLPQYDFGSFLGLINNNKKEMDKMLLTGFGNKLYDYIAARLPVVVSVHGKTICDFVLINGIGNAISNYSDLRETLYTMREKETYYNENIKKLSDKILDKNELMKFIKKEIYTWW
jgi:hypothetical protein